MDNIDNFVDDYFDSISSVSILIGCLSAMAIQFTHACAA